MKKKRNLLINKSEKSHRKISTSSNANAILKSLIISNIQGQRYSSKLLYQCLPDDPKSRNERRIPFRPSSSHPGVE